MKTNPTQSDRELRALLQANTTQHLPAPWFTKKVMNRLPERRQRTMARIEYTVYIIALLATMAVGAFDIGRTASAGYLTVMNIITFTAIIVMFSALCWLILAPTLERLQKNA